MGRRGQLSKRVNGKGGGAGWMRRRMGGCERAGEWVRG